MCSGSKAERWILSPRDRTELWMYAVCRTERCVRVACGSRHRLLRGPLQGLLDYKSSVLNSQWFSPAFHFHVVLHAGKS